MEFKNALDRDHVLIDQIEVTDFLDGESFVAFIVSGEAWLVRYIYCICVATVIDLFESVSDGGGAGG